MKILLLMVSLVVPTMVVADTSYFCIEEKALENHFDEGVMHVNGREFLMGDLHDWPKADDDYSVSFMVRSSIWLREFLDEDAVFGVREDLTMRYQEQRDPGSAPSDLEAAGRLTVPFYTIDFDFRLAKA